MRTLRPWAFPRGFRVLLPLALGVYVLLASTTVRGVGIVGEVAASWALARPPTVLTTLHPPSVVTAERWGPLVASPTRPTESLVVGSVQVPLAVNAYTGGVADWPARAARALWSVRAGEASTIALGALFIGLAHRFLRFHGTLAAADGVALLLATDWCFLFYRKVLGGTEVLLHAAGLLVLWSLWSRRWKGGVHGTVAIAVGVGLGLSAKVTFGASLVAWLVTAWAMRWDRAALLPPVPVRRWMLVAIPLACLTPLVLAAIHHAGVAPAARVPSHDSIGLQLTRLFAPSPAREGWANLLAMFGDPLAWFTWSLHAAEVPWFSGLRALGFVVTGWGVALEWRTRTVSPSAALLRFLSVAVPLQVGLLFAANHDLHHLAQATPPLALLCALAADRVAGALVPPRSALRTIATLVLLSPHVVAGVQHLRATDEVVASLPRSTFTEAGQSELIALVRGAGATRVVTSDYEVYGMAEVRAPEVEWVHTWAAVARGERSPEDVLSLAAGGWYLVLRPTAPMIYNWRPDSRTLHAAAGRLGLDVEVAGRLADAKGEWAVLYRIGAPGSAPVITAPG